MSRSYLYHSPKQLAISTRKQLAFLFLALIFASEIVLPARAQSSCDTLTCSSCQVTNGVASCTACLNSTYKRLQNTCVQFCPAYTSDQSGVCEQYCYQSCGSCIGGGQFDCLTCRTNRNLEVSSYFIFGECKCGSSFSDDLTATCSDSNEASMFNAIVFLLAIVSLVFVVLQALISWSGFIFYYFIDTLQCVALIYYVNFANSYQFDDILSYLDKSNISSLIKPNVYDGASRYNYNYMNLKVAHHLNSVIFALEQLVVIIVIVLLWLLAFATTKYYQMKNKRIKEQSVSPSIPQQSGKRVDQINQSPMLKSANQFNLNGQPKSLSQIQEEQVEEDQTKNLKKKDLDESQRPLNDVSQRTSRQNLFLNDCNSINQSHNGHRTCSCRTGIKNKGTVRKPTLNQSRTSLNSLALYESKDHSNFRFSKGLQNQSTSQGNKESQYSSRLLSSNFKYNNNQSNKIDNNTKNKNFGRINESQLQKTNQQYYNGKSNPMSSKKVIKYNDNRANEMSIKREFSNKNPFSFSLIIFFFMITNSESLIAIFGQFMINFTFNSIETIISTLFCVFMIIYIYGFLFYLSKKFWRTIFIANNKISSHYTQMFYLIDNYSQEKVYQRLYFAVSFVRKLISAVACIFLYHYPLAQALVLLFNHFFYLVYLLVGYPVKNKLQKIFIFIVHLEVLLCYVFETIVVSKNPSSTSSTEISTINSFTLVLVYLIMVLLITFIIYSLYVIIKWIIYRCKNCINDRNQKNRPPQQQEIVDQSQMRSQIVDEELKRKVHVLERELEDLKARQKSIEKLQIIEVREEKDFDDSVYNGKLIIYDEPKKYNSNIQDESFRSEFDDQHRLIKSQLIQIEPVLNEATQNKPPALIPPPPPEKKKILVQSRQVQVNFDQDQIEDDLYSQLGLNFQRKSIVFESAITEMTEEESEIKKKKEYKSQDIQVDSTCFEPLKKFNEVQIQTIQQDKQKESVIKTTNSKIFGEEDDEELIDYGQNLPIKQQVTITTGTQTQQIKDESPPKNNSMKKSEVKDEQSILDKIIKEIQNQDIPKLEDEEKKENKEPHNHRGSYLSIQTPSILDATLLTDDNRKESAPHLYKFLQSTSPTKQYAHNKVGQKKTPGIQWHETNKFDKYFNGTQMRSKVQELSRLNTAQQSRTQSQDHLSSHIYLGPTTPREYRGSMMSQDEIVPNSARSSNKDDYNITPNNVFKRQALNSLQSLTTDMKPQQQQQNNDNQQSLPTYNDRYNSTRNQPQKSNINNFFASQSSSRSQNTSPERSRSNILNLHPIPKAFDKQSKINN